jgi:hypothetical protein
MDVIRSRCTELDFKKITKEEAIELYKKADELKKIKEIESGPKKCSECGKEITDEDKEKVIDMISKIDLDTRCLLIVYFTAALSSFDNVCAICFERKSIEVNSDEVDQDAMQE